MEQVVASKLRLMMKEETKPHILLVEDARDIREPLARYLREHSYRATTAQDAASARKVMKSSAIDLVVLDIMMPGEDGLSLCRSIRETTQIPVILLTARGEEVDRIIGWRWAPTITSPSRSAPANWWPASPPCCAGP